MDKYHDTVGVDSLAELRAQFPKEVFVEANASVRQGSRYRELIGAWVDDCLPHSPTCKYCSLKYTRENIVRGQVSPAFFHILAYPAPKETVKIFPICDECSWEHHRLKVDRKYVAATHATVQ